MKHNRSRPKKKFRKRAIAYTDPDSAMLDHSRCRCPMCNKGYAIEFTGAVHRCGTGATQ